MRVRLWLSVASVVGMMTGSAQALPITLSLSSSLLTTTPGSTVTFAGTLTDIGGSVTFLNGDTFTTMLPLDDTPFFTNFPLVLVPFQSVTAPMFSVRVPTIIAPGLYSGTFSVLGGTTPLAGALLASQQFTVSVVPGTVPEPDVIALLVMGSIAALRRRRASGRR